MLAIDELETRDANQIDTLKSVGDFHYRIWIKLIK
jgi:hypothetical protein